ncbi:unnamed protein product [Hyaloperonospora brassicae]|uniref:Uncharacterized protein n=1 Tax=Hyaloperonospora brassicae TaxID=162125 RepID=A0AAV0T2J0_HYABA|nr:unnamed protein product [Hyaloperonospora brassicae]
MAAQIADAGVALSRNEATPAMSKLETTRLALAQQQKKRIDAAVARVTSKREGSKRKGLGERGADAGHRSKKLKTVVDVTSARAADRKQSSLARRMVDRFAALPEPEPEDAAAPDGQEPVTRSVARVHQFVTSPKADAADANQVADTRLQATQHVTASVETTTVAVTVTGKKTVQVETKEEEQEGEEEEEEEEEEETAAVEEEEDEAEEAQKSAWDGPTSNFHVKQLGLDDNVDIYAPIAQQQKDVQRVRERVKYMPRVKHVKLHATPTDSEADLDFAPNGVCRQDSDAASASEATDSESQATVDETEQFAHETAVPAAAVHRTWRQRVFVFTPLFIVATSVLVFALLFAIDWSQETLQFCAMDAESAAADPEAVFSCASFVETQSLIKRVMRETADKVQQTVQVYLG